MKHEATRKKHEAIQKSQQRGALLFDEKGAKKGGMKRKFS
ncbi:hypothetical protein LINPERHAP1_LOCUS30078, partial [Linum perenne]